MKNTSFKDYLIAKRNIIIVLMCINSFALIVNILKIEGSFKDWRCSRLTHNLFYYSDSEYENVKSSEFKENFWPFVQFFTTDESRWYCDDWEDRHRNEFRGIFRYYDYSEFFVYSILILLGLYISWEVRRPK